MLPALAVLPIIAFLFWFARESIREHMAAQDFPELDDFMKRLSQEKGTAKRTGRERIAITGKTFFLAYQRYKKGGKIHEQLFLRLLPVSKERFGIVKFLDGEIVECRSHSTVIARVDEHVNRQLHTLRHRAHAMFKTTLPEQSGFFHSAFLRPRHFPLGAYTLRYLWMPLLPHS